MADGEQSTLEPVPPSEHERAAGCASVGIGGKDFLVGEGERWTEDGVYIIRSTEFDVIADGDSFEEAMEVFVEQTLAYASLLAKLVEDQEATPVEHEAFDKLAPRVLSIFEAAKRVDQQRRRGPFSRKRGEHQPNWRRRSNPPTNSSLPSPA